MNLVDVHCHLNHKDFQNNLEEVLERAKKAGVKVILCSGVNHPANEEVLALAKKYPQIKCSLGLYPIDLLGLGPDEVGITRQIGNINLAEELDFIRQHQKKVVSIGEVGLDFHWDKEHWEQQKENFRKIIRFAKEINKPLIIHSRDAEKECIDILEEEIKDKEIPVSMHCFSGNKKLIKRAADAGFYFSIPPNIVKLQHFQTLVEMVDLKQLFTETDAPWLSPFPGKKNEPAYVIEAIKKIAEIKKLSAEEVAKQIWENYERVFLNK